ncbi:MAG: cytidylate kinase-like family protein [Proteobacteria bacterium]|nr:cytidylate kinase-like family protein [Pseudomonadota bacterium]
MSVISISRGSYSQGKIVAEKLAEKLGYTCVSREILLDASEHFNIPETTLTKAVKDAPSFFDRFSKDREKYVRTIRAALLNYVGKDNVVYHGFSGQYFLSDISHVLKVRILADLEHRAEILMKEDNISKFQAESNIKKIDEQRRKWGRQLYGVEPQDPILYDLVVNVAGLTVDETVDLIVHTINLPSFQVTDASRKKLNDMALAAEVYALLTDLPAVDVSSDDGKVRVVLKAPLNEKDRLDNQIRDLTRKTKGINAIELAFERAK